MARPSDRRAATLLRIAALLEPVAQASAQTDRAAVQYLADSLAACGQWTRDTTESARRRAARMAEGAHALARFAPMGDATRRARAALEGFAAALILFTESDCDGALRAATGAADMALLEVLDVAA